MPSKYQQWITEQEEEFIVMVHPDKYIPVHYVNDDKEGITLAELEELDNKFINNSPEGGVK